MPSLTPLPQLPLNERRRTPRFLVTPVTPLTVGVAVLGTGWKPRSFTGRVRDMSEAGLAIVLPLDESRAEIAEGRRALVAVVSLPETTITLSVVTVHCSPLGDGANGKGYVVGVRITEMCEGDRDLLAEFLAGGNEG
jgi:hypothetical protein